jgi:signal transduction histidine kinase/ligand-binding sensor domain-containing protein|tara:strand:+ start:2013 stop:5156 length:3144 start_codon:yes stop_codon:yes gene_type:complete
LVRVIGFIVFGVLWAGLANSQPYHFSVTQYNAQNIGLSHNTVTNLALDKSGFLWVGTIDGLNRFDGKSVKTYRHNSSDSTSISDNFIHGILVDDDGTIWVGTRDGGINKFNPRTEKFARYQYSEKIRNGFPSAPIYLFMKDREGAFWASIGAQAFGLFDPDKGSFRGVEIKDKKTGIELYSPNAVVEFKDGSFLGASFTGLYHIPSEEVEAYKSNPQKRVLTAERVDQFKGENVQNLSRVIVDELNQIWVYSQNSGNQKVPKELLSESIIQSLESGMASEHNQQLYVEKEEYLIGTSEEKGLQFINKNTGERSYQELKTGSKDFSPTALYHDPQGGIWSYSWGQGFVRLEEQTAIKLVNEDTNPEMGAPFILALEEEQGKGIWFAGAEGIRFWNEEAVNTERFQGLPKELIENQIWSLERSENGLWVVTVTNGLFYIPINGEGKPEGSARNFNPENSFINSYLIHQVFIDSRGWMWVGYEGDGLQLVKNPVGLLENEPVNVTHFNSNTGGENVIGGEKIRRIYEDRDGGIWLATMENGFTKIEVQEGQFGRISVFRHDPSNSNSVSFNDGRSIYHQNDSTFWFATYGGGITRWNPIKNEFRRFGTEQGLSNNSTYGILPDVDPDFIWISTNNGLARLHTPTLSFTAFTEEDGIQNKEFNTGAYLRLSDERVVFGGIGGFNILDTEELTTNKKEPVVQLTGIRLFNEPYNTDTSSVFEKELILPYNKNFLSFEFAALDYEKPQQNKYAYKMVGVDEQWVEAGNRTFADYPNLEPGEYNFRVKAANSYGVWNEEGIQLAVNITPPWWQTWWFRSLSGLTGLVLLVVGIRHISQRRLREQIRKMEVENRLRNERERISRDLHDHVGAQLANIISGLTLIEKYNEKKNTARSAELMNSLRGDANVTIKQLRETIWALNQNSLDLEGFVDHLKKYFKSQSALCDELQVHYHQEVEDKVTLSSTQALNVFRIIQEAAQNTLKYAGAENLDIHFSRNNGSLKVCIKDDGTFKENGQALNGGYGLGNMRKRAEELGGTLDMDKKNGTEIKLSFNL